MFYIVPVTSAGFVEVSGDHHEHRQTCIDQFRYIEASSDVSIDTPAHAEHDMDYNYADNCGTPQDIEGLDAAAWRMGGIRQDLSYCIAYRI